MLPIRACGNLELHKSHDGMQTSDGRLYHCQGVSIPQDDKPVEPKMTTYYVTVMHSAPTGRMVDGVLSSTFVDLPGDPADKLVFDWMVGLIETGLGVQHVLPLWWVRQPAS